MSETKLDHIGIAVRDLETALQTYRDALGLPLTGIEVVEDQKVRVAMLDLGGPRIELLEPTADDSPIAKFLEKRGEGIHHICLGVDDCRGRLEELSARDKRVIDSAPRPGAEGKQIAFVHPKSFHGVLIELSEDPAAP